MDAKQSRSRLRLAGSLVAAALGGALLVVLAVWLFYRSGDPLVAPTVLLSGADLHLVNGEGVQTAEGLEIRQAGSNGIAMVQGAIRALEADRYQSLSWQVDGLMPDQQLRLIWATAANPRVPRDLVLQSDQQGDGLLNLLEVPYWEGEIIAIGLAVVGPIHTPISVQQLELRPKAVTLAMLVGAAADEWAQHEGWTGRSINLDLGAGLHARFPPVPLAALWIGFSSLLYALINPPWLGFRTLAPYVVFGLIGWLVLDLRWQWDLVQRLHQTETTYAGLDGSGRQLAGPDRNFYPFLQEIRRHLPPPPARVFIIGSDPSGYAAGRARYHLLPHNVHVGLSTLPSRTEAVAGDYVLILLPLREVIYDRARNLLISQATQIPADILLDTRLGALYRLREGS